MTDLNKKIQLFKYILIMFHLMGILSSIIVTASMFDSIIQLDQLLDENSFTYYWLNPLDLPLVLPSKISEKSKSFYHIES